MQVSQRKVFKWVRVGVGVTLIWGALGVLGYRLGWEAHSHKGQTMLLKSARVYLLQKHGPDCRQADPAPPTSDGQLAGVLEIPKLKVTAPVEEGTGDAVLNVAVGHADATPLPGSPGTSVLLAHDVSYFADIDQLQPGDVLDYEVGCLTYEYQVTGHRVVAAGSAVPQLSGDALVLDTCWPTDALWYTPDRYLVEATESKVASSAGASDVHSTSWVTDYGTPAPPSLVAQGLTLDQNEYPMGTLLLTGTPDQSWEQSPGPLAVEAAALEAFFGAMHAAAQQRSDWWQDVAPGVAMPQSLDGAWVSSNDAPLDVTIAADGDTPTSVVLSTVVSLSGGPAPGEYSEQVTETVEGTTLVISNWEVGNG